MDLKTQFEEMADAVEKQERRRVLAALRIGARLALMRVRFVGSSYITGADLVLVEHELDGITPQTPAAPIDETPAVPEPVGF